jgi:antitoxin component of MazEF toxin-antitoxin module
MSTDYRRAAIEAGRRTLARIGKQIADGFKFESVSNMADDDGIVRRVHEPPEPEALPRRGWTPPAPEVPMRESKLDIIPPALLAALDARVDAMVEQRLASERALLVEVLGQSVAGLLDEMADEVARTIDGRIDEIRDVARAAEYRHGEVLDLPQLPRRRAG